jgi:hypothetical protein
MMAVAVNTGPRQAHELQLDIEPWLEAKAGKFEARLFDMQGQPTGQTRHESKQFTIRTPSLDQWQLCVIEVVPSASPGHEAETP